MTSPAQPRPARAPRARVAAPGLDTADTAIEQACRTLHLPTIRARYPDFAGTALREQASYKQFLADILGVEVSDRDERRRSRLVHEAGFPRIKHLQDFDFTANPALTPAAVNTLTDPAWVRAGQPLCLIGDSGTGKSHLLIAIGTAIAEAGLKVRYTTTARLANELVEAADERHLSKPSPATAKSTYFASTNSATSNSTQPARNYYSKSSPNVRNAARSPSRPTPRSPNGPAPRQHPRADLVLCDWRTLSRRPLFGDRRCIDWRCTRLRCRRSKYYCVRRLCGR